MRGKQNQIIDGYDLFDSDSEAVNFLAHKTVAEKEAEKLIADVSLQVVSVDELNHKALEGERRKTGDPNLQQMPAWRVVNYIRHKMTNYNLLMNWIHDNVDTVKAYFLKKDLKIAVLEKTEKAYPHLAEECAIQRRNVWETPLQLPRSKTASKGDARNSTPVK